MNRVNKTKVLLGGAMKRKSPSKSSLILDKLEILNNNILDYGCGYGFDADHFNWDKLRKDEKNKLTIFDNIFQ